MDPETEEFFFPCEDATEKDIEAAAAATRMSELAAVAVANGKTETPDAQDEEP